MDMQRSAAAIAVGQLNQDILNAFPTGVVICDVSSVITHCNDELCQLFGYRPEELIGSTIEALLPEASRVDHRNHFNAFMKAPQKRMMGIGRDLFGCRKDGTTFPIEIGLNPIETDNGQQVIATIADISKRKRLEENFKQIVSAAPIGMLISDADGIIKQSNQQLLSIFGYEADELIGQSVELLVPERNRQQHIAQRTDFVTNPSLRPMGVTRDLTGLHKTGTEIPIEIALNPIDTNDGHYVIATINDISERKKAELKLKQANADLDEFTYVASHDLKSPLRGIASLAEWIEEDLGDNISDDIRNNLNRIHVRIERMESLVDDLLSYARSGRTQDDINDINIQQTLDSVVKFVSPPEEFKIETGGYKGTIQTSATPLETVLRNLISNAIKHHDKDCGLIRVNVSIEDAFAVFDVEDDGPGIPPSAHERVFKLFQSLSNENGPRSGVGLAVSKRLVESHGGKIEIHSQADHRGTRFRFWWPRFKRRDLDE